MKKQIRIIIILVLFTYSSVIYAVDDRYIGLTIGNSQFEVSKTQFINNLNQSGFSVPTIEEENAGIPFKLYFGKEFIDFKSKIRSSASFEIGLVNFGTNIKSGKMVSNTDTIYFVASRRILSGYFSGVINIYLTENISISPSIGIYYAKVNASVTFNEFTDEESSSNFGLTYGGSLNYKFTDSIGILVQVGEFKKVGIKNKTNEESVNIVSLGLNYYL